MWGCWLACISVELSRHLLLTGSDTQCGCHLLQYQDYSLKSPEASKLPQNIWCLASAVKRFYLQAPLSAVLRLCRGRCGGCRQLLQACCTSGSLMHLLRNTCATNCLFYSTCSEYLDLRLLWDYNWISRLWCRQKSLQRVTWSGWEWGRVVELVLVLGRDRRLVLCACWN